jgi:hypothetical protein
VIIRLRDVGVNVPSFRSMEWNAVRALSLICSRCYTKFPAGTSSSSSSVHVAPTWIIGHA